jgi:hypothetical protein
LDRSGLTCDLDHTTAAHEDHGDSGRRHVLLFGETSIGGEEHRNRPRLPVEAERRS